MPSSPPRLPPLHIYITLLYKFPSLGLNTFSEITYFRHSWRKKIYIYTYWNPKIFSLLSCKKKWSFFFLDFFIHPRFEVPRTWKLHFYNDEALFVCLGCLILSTRN
jgi:hypothetical protein